VKLLLDEMFPTALAEQLRARGHDVVSVHDDSHHHLLSKSDQVILRAALEDGRALVTENVQDFRPLEATAFSRHEPVAVLILTTNQRFPRAQAGTLGRLVIALDAVLRAPDAPTGSFYLQLAHVDED
jgi:predicted nuclease of predicted toxin-antitoxin system